MEILDLRSRVERSLGSAGVDGRPPHLLARLAGRAADRLAVRRAARRRRPPSTTLVVSVGNLRVGGTGKTPVSMALAADLADRGVIGAILTRGYGASHAGPLTVAADDPRGADEARLMAGALAGRPWVVVQSRHRELGLELALSASPTPQVVILEDGYQTDAVGRHLDILILDAWTREGDRLVPLTGPVLPFGPYRETAAGASRAQVWLLESDEAEPGSSANRDVVGFTRRLSLRQAAGMAAPGDQVHGLLAGLARPEGFETGCTALLAAPPVLAVRCRDHSPYDRALVDRILAAGKTRGVNAWITTGKDWIKLADLWPPAVPMQVVDLAVHWHGRKTLPDLVEERLVAMGPR